MNREKIGLGSLEEKSKALADDGKTPMFIALDGKAAGIVAVADTVKEGSVEAIKALQDLGIEVVMITGDNRRTAEAIARTIGASHRTARIARSDFETQREHIFVSMDQPSIDGVNTYFVSRAAATAGLKVALSGLGGDELSGGYSSFRQVPSLARRLSALLETRGVTVAGFTTERVFELPVHSPSM